MMAMTPLLRNVDPVSTDADPQAALAMAAPVIAMVMMMAVTRAIAMLIARFSRR